MKKTIGLLLALILVLSILTGCGGSEPGPEKELVTDASEIYSVLDRYDFGFYAAYGEPGWYGSTTDEERVGFAGELMEMFSDLGYDMSGYDGNSLAQQINDYYDQDKSMSIFDTACAVLGIDGGNYGEIYSAFAAQAEQEAAGVSLAGAWDNDEVGNSLVFDDHGGAVLSNGETSVECTYEFDGEMLTLYLTDQTVYAYLDDGGNIVFNEGDGYFSRVETAFYVPGGAGGGDPDGELGGVTQYIDDLHNVIFTCPDWMTVITEGIGYTTDAAIVGDGQRGYVTIDNVSGEWLSYSGSWDEFLCDYFVSYFDEFYEPLYGEWDDGDWELVDFSDPGYQHYSSFAGYGSWWSAITGNYWNGEHDIAFLMVALSTDGGNIVKCILLPSDADESQFNSLCNEVTDFDVAR